MPRKQIDTELVALLDLIEGDRFSREEIKRHLRGYRCSRDRDVETYLQRYAYTNERNGTSRTYLVIDYDKYNGENLPPIVAYFTLAITSTDFSRVDQEVKKDLLGFVSKANAKDHYSGYLLAQIGRSDDYCHEEFVGSDLLTIAEAKIAEAMRLVGGRVIYLDCKRSGFLIHLYEESGYVVLDVASIGDHPVKMVKVPQI